MEVTEETVRSLVDAYVPDALEALEVLREPPLFVRAINGSSMLVPATIETLHSLKGLTVAALLDTGATNGFISERLVEEKGLETEPLAVPVPGYNADSTPNKNGRITHIVRLRLTVQDHTEVFPFAVTDTGKNDIIIGFNWLQQHNPEINWAEGSLSFSRCPAACKRARLQEQWDEEDNEPVEEGD